MQCAYEHFETVPKFDDCDCSVHEQTGEIFDKIQSIKLEALGDCADACQSGSDSDVCTREVAASRYVRLLRTMRMPDKYNMKQQDFDKILKTTTQKSIGVISRLLNDTKDARSRHDYD